MIPEEAVWTIFFLPLAAFVIISFVVRPFFNDAPQQSGLITIVAIACSLALSAWALQSVIESRVTPSFTPHEWLSVGDIQIRIGLILDPLTAIMLVVVTGVSLMVQVYSLGYMRGDPGYSRYFAIMSLFTASMIGLVISSNIVQLYVFWELVGVCSYLLIGFWFHRPAAVAAAKKAFLVTRIGDFGFLLAILYLFLNRGAFQAQSLDPLAIKDIYQAIPLVQDGTLAALGGMGLTWLALGIFAGAMGKSAQFPLHVWLPDAMEGPTPVSALIHAATMVAAGVFLVARFFPVFDASSDAMQTVALVGAFTAIFAATMGLATNDIKRVLAYSTVSQLGFMIAALGIGAYGAAIFHLFNHAFFKALLFMGAGSVNHATGTFDMRYMGGLRKAMPWTYATMIVGTLSLAGIFPLSGFWSKDEILNHAWRGDGVVDDVVFWLLAVGVFLTAVYAFRLIFMTFHGEFKGGVDKELEVRAAGSPAGASNPSPHSKTGLAESPWSMVLPMVFLGIAAIVSGYLANPLGFRSDFLGIDAHWFSNFAVPPAHLPFELEKFNLPIALTSVAVSVAGIGLAAAFYLWPKVSLGKPILPLRGIHRLVSEKYYMDHLFEKQIVSRGFYRVVGGTLDWFDRRIVDNVPEFVGWFSRNIGRAISLLQTGHVQGYAVGISLGVALILGAYLIWG